VNAYHQRGVLGAAFRVVPTTIRSLDDLRLPASIGAWTHKPRGLVLVTGATGSGKSTTLAALIDQINETRACHIMTIEDPIEFLHRHKRSLINQRELGGDTQSFANALRSALRQDPDVILVGEMRDLETIQIALTAAETGHLVFGTLHTSDAPQTIDRVIDVFPSHQQEQVRVMLANALQGVCCQQLLPTPEGGRVVACEVLVATSAVRNLIREGKTHQIYSMMQTGAQHGMQSMDTALALLVRDGAVRRDVALERSSTPAELQRLFDSGSLPVVPNGRPARAVA
jgi:twitching motility protein PilT